LVYAVVVFNAWTKAKAKRKTKAKACAIPVFAFLFPCRFLDLCVNSKAGLSP
jgi:hypothetical protein